MTKILRPTALLVFLVLISSACGDAGADPDASSGSAPPALPSLDLFEQPIADAPDPADRAGAAADHVQCANGLSNGGWSPDFGPPQTTSDADSALAAFLREGWFSLPTNGYAAACATASVPERADSRFGRHGVLELSISATNSCVY
ncbi:MAG: hypothetical protein GY720_04105 [bacterium]|nr:hypothetical protein [bacterium]